MEREHSPKFNMVLDHYKAGRWSETAVRNAVKRGYITKWEYEEIVGEPYA